MVHCLRSRSGWILSAAAAALAVVLSGCDSKPGYPATLEFAPRTDRLVIRVPATEPAGYGEAGKLDRELAALDSLGGQTLDPGQAAPAHRRAIDIRLAELFGSPAAPAVNAAGAESLGLSADRLAEGGRLFRRHCLQCHGLAGDGRGPTGQWIYPHPRDFRRGAFKFVSTGDGGKPKQSDLARTIRDGLKNTAMPAFGLLPEDQRDLMAAYVTYLSLRGQTEFLALTSVVADDESDPAAYASERLDLLIAQWRRAETAPGVAAPAAPDDAAKQSPAHLAAVRRGHELFAATAATDCMKCHEDFGRKPAFRYDVWGTVVRPADLTAGGYKGGDRPEDLYHRIRGGIQPAGMPAHPSLSDFQVWDLVWFVRALPFPRELPDDVRAKVYP
jgi:mono/diheme cytochrome c family protein